MCLLCSHLWIEDHWAEAAEDAGEPGGPVVLETHATRRGQRLRDRADRARLASRVLAPFGLAVRDWEGATYLLADRKGAQAVVPDLAAVWPEAERLTGRIVDPLDAALLARLRDGAGQGR